MVQADSMVTWPFDSNFMGCPDVIAVYSSAIFPVFTNSNWSDTVTLPPGTEPVFLPWVCPLQNSDPLQSFYHLYKDHN